MNINLWNSYWIVIALTGIMVLVSLLLEKIREKIRIRYVLFAGVFLAGFFFTLPMYLKKLNMWPAVWNSIQHAFRLFTVDGDFMEWVANFDRYPPLVKNGHILAGSVLYMVAPLFTFGFILSFFKNFVARLRGFCPFWAETHVFSELNEKTLALATTLKKTKFWGIIPRNLIIFTDILDEKEELSLDLKDSAEKMGAILFRKDLMSLRFYPWKRRKVKFYLISEDESEKIKHAEHIIEHYDKESVELRIFSDDIRTSWITDMNASKKIMVKRVNDIQTLIYHELYENGIHLFEGARKTGENEHVISVVLVGLGKYGREMLKALVWYCQMKEYKLKITAFDSDEKAKEKMTARYPELMDKNHNKQDDEGEARYDIDIHSGVDVSVPEFEEKLMEIKDATFFFVCLGDDETNLRVSAGIRSMSERVNYTGDGHKPDIETVIYDSNVAEKMGILWGDVYGIGEPLKGGIKNFKGQSYNILMIGDLKRFYSEKILIDSELEAAGLKMHEAYYIEGEKIKFTIDKMKDGEWEKFLADNKLKHSWERYVKELDKKTSEESSFNKDTSEQDKVDERKVKSALADERWRAFLGIEADCTLEPSEDEKAEVAEEKQKKPLTLSDKIQGFSFLREDELDNKEKGLLTKKSEGEIVASRVHQWEKIVYAKFMNLTDEEKKEWEATEKAVCAEAQKSFRVEYNNRSSVAKAIHRRLRLDPRVPETIPDKPWSELELEEKVEMGNYEHIRWNAYMRVGGYRYGEKRNDLAKVHSNLVPSTQLTNDDLRKDA